MTVFEADQRLISSMGMLSQQMGMLSGMTVCYGNQNETICHSLGRRREVLLKDGIFHPAPEPITGATVYDLASLTKLYTLIAVLQLVQKGIICFEDSIFDLDRRFVRLKDCSLYDCLTYLARLQTQERVDGQKDAKAAREVLFSVRRVPLHDESRLYSDMNALVLQFVVEAVSGLPFYEYLKRHVLMPAGLFETWAVVPEERLCDLMDYNYEHKWVNGAWQVTTDVIPGLPHDPKARLLQTETLNLSGHAGLFATAKDVCLFVQALLSGTLIGEEMLLSIGVNRTGYLTHHGDYRQFLGLLCFCRSPIQQKSEVPGWMGLRSFGLAGYTGNHLAIDPEKKVFDLLLGNRCHNRLSQVIPEEAAESLGLRPDGSGQVQGPDGRVLLSSFRFIHQKDRLVHGPVYDCLVSRGWL